MASDVMENRRRILMSAPHLATATGSNVRVDIAEPKVERLAVLYQAKRTGSGTPSPDNVRTIYGLTHVFASIGTETYQISLGGTYYGGTVDLVSGVMTVTNIQKNLTGADFTSYYPAGNAYSDRVCTPRALLPDVSTGSGNPQGAIIASNMLCDVNGAANYKKASSAPYVAMSGTAGNTSLFMMFPESYGITSLALAQAWINDHPTTVLFRLATPQTVTLTPQTIIALRGQQAVQSSSGNYMEITYWTH